MMYQTSRGLRSAAMLLVFVSASTPFIGGLTAFSRGTYAFDLVVGQAGVMFAIALRGGWIRCDEAGVSARKLLFERRFPWGVVESIEPADCVVVQMRDGRRFRLWAVQRARIAAILRRESVVDRVVVEMGEYQRSDGGRKWNLIGGDETVGAPRAR